MKAGERGHPIFAAFFDRMARGVEKRGMGVLRDAVLSGATGRVAEVGAGTGLNFAHYPSSVTEVVATEPDPHMLKRARAAASGASAPIRIEQATADELPFEDASIDTVVATLVLCTVPDQESALREIRRVLKPEGRLLFLEHVRASEPRLARWQDRIQPLWTRFGAGCHPNRDTPAAIERAGFEFEMLERFPFSPNMGVDKPHAKGVARPR